LWAVPETQGTAKMQKPLGRKPKRGLRKNSIKRIVPQTHPSNQIFQHLLSHVWQGELTNALELLEKRGHYGETAFFIVASIQDIGGGR
jgi:hypothetical protein